MDDEIITQSTEQVTSPSPQGIATTLSEWPGPKDHRSSMLTVDKAHENSSQHIAGQRDPVTRTKPSEDSASSRRSNKSRVSSKVKSLVQSIAAAPVNLADSIVPMDHNALKPHEVTSGTDITLDAEDDSINSENCELDEPTPEDKDLRLSAVMEMARQWMSEELGIDDDGEETIPDSEPSNERNGIRRIRQGSKSIATKMGKAAVSVAKTPLHLSRLLTVGEGNETSDSPPKATSKIVAAPARVASKMKDVAVGISKVPKTIAKGRDENMRIYH